MSEKLVLGVDVGGTNLKFVLTNAVGVPVAQGDIPTDPTDPAATIARLADVVARHLAGDLDRLGGVGLACAGIVAPDTGLLGRSPNLPGWQDSNLAEALAGSFGDRPFALVNDVNAALYGEYRFGAGRGCSNLVMIALGTGVGGGVLIDGTLLTGLAHGAGEIGHMTLQLDGARCTCGSRGCLEAYCGSVGIVRRARELAGEAGATDAWRAMVDDRGSDLTSRDCTDLAVVGDVTARGLYQEVGRRLGQAVASLINVLAPDRVIIGGGVAQAGDLVLEPCRAMVASHVMGTRGRTTPVVTADLGPHAAAMGAMALARERGAAC